MLLNRVERHGKAICEQLEIIVDRENRHVVVFADGAQQKVRVRPMDALPTAGIVCDLSASQRERPYTGIDQDLHGRLR